MKLKSLALLIAAASILTAQPTLAAQFIETFTGTLGTNSSGGPTAWNVDTTGYFGTAGANLTGDQFSASLVWNTSTFGGSYFSYPGQDQLDFSGTPDSTAITAFITIDGKTLSFPHHLIRGYVAQVTTPSPDVIVLRPDYFPDAGVSVEDAFGYKIFDTVLYGLSSTPAVLTPYDATGIAGFGYFIVDPLSLYLAPTGVTLAETNASFPSPIPEPTTWAFLILGFTCIGAALRKQRLRLFAP